MASQATTTEEIGHHENDYISCVPLHISFYDSVHGSEPFDQCYTQETLFTIQGQKEESLPENEAVDGDSGSCHESVEEESKDEYLGTETLRKTSSMTQKLRKNSRLTKSMHSFRSNLLLRKTKSDSLGSSNTLPYKSYSYLPWLHDLSIMINKVGGRHVLRCERFNNVYPLEDLKKPISWPRVELDLRKSHLRDRLVLREKMEVAFGADPRNVLVIKKIHSCCAPCTYQASRGEDYAQTYGFTDNHLEIHTQSFESLFKPGGEAFSTESQPGARRARASTDLSELSDIDTEDIREVRLGAASDDWLGVTAKGQSGLGVAGGRDSVGSQSRTNRVRFASAQDAVSGETLHEHNAIGGEPGTEGGRGTCSNGGTCNRFPSMEVELWQYNDVDSVVIGRTTLRESHDRCKKWHWSVGGSAKADIQLRECEDTIACIIECRGTNWFLLTEHAPPAPKVSGSWILNKGSFKRKSQAFHERSISTSQIRIRVDNLAEGFDLESHDVFMVGSKGRIEVKQEAPARSTLAAPSTAQRLADVTIEAQEGRRSKQWTGTGEYDCIRQVFFPFKDVVADEGGTTETARDSGKDRIVFGRDPAFCRCALEDPKLAKEQFALLKKDNKFVVKPLRGCKPMYAVVCSRTMNWRNPLQLRTGTVFRVGCSEYRVVGLKYSKAGFSSHKQETHDILLGRVSVSSASIRFQNPLASASARDQQDAPSHVSSVDTQHPVQSAVEENVRGPLLELDDVIRDYKLGDLQGPFLVLHCIKGPLQKRVYLLNRPETCIGNDPHNHIPVWNDVEMAPVQCRIVYFEKKWFLQDISYCERSSRLEMHQTTISRRHRRRYSSISKHGKDTPFERMQAKLRGATCVRLREQQYFVIQAGDVLLAGNTAFLVSGTRVLDSPTKSKKKTEQRLEKYQKAASKTSPKSEESVKDPRCKVM